MTPRAAGGTVVLLAVVSMLVLGCSAREDDSGRATRGDENTATAIEIDLPEGASPLVPIYFPNQRGTLSPEEQAIGPWSNPEEGARLLIEAVLRGPGLESQPGELLVAPLPSGTALGVTNLSESAHLYINLVSTEHTRPPVGGSQTELLSVYSLVDTVLLNVPEIEAVILLWNGRQLPTFAGHLDTSLPLRADPDLVRARR